MEQPHLSGRVARVHRHTKSTDRDRRRRLQMEMLRDAANQGWLAEAAGIADVFDEDDLDVDDPAG